MAAAGAPASLTRYRGEIAAGLLLLAVIVVGILTRPVLPVDETRYITAAWEMWRDGHVLVPHFNGHPYSHKPPLLFWSIELAWTLTGPLGWVARLVPTLFALACLPLAAATARAMWPAQPEVGGRAALALAGLAIFEVYGSLLRFEALLTFCALLAAYALVRAWRDGGRRWWCLHGLALGLGVLAKGPVILLLVLPVAVLMPLWAEAPRANAGRWYRGLGLAFGVGIAVVAAWLLPAATFGGKEYREAILWTQTADRMVESFAHARPAWFYLALLPALGWPWLWWPPLWRAFGRLPRGDAMVRFCALWLVAGLVGLSLISAKQPHYAVPLLPALALLVARALPLASARRAWILLPAAPAIALLLAAIAAELGLLPAEVTAEIPVPLPDMTAAIAVVLALLVAAWLAGAAWPTVALIAPALLIVGQVYAIGPLEQMFDKRAEAALIRARQANGVAWVGANYAGEFTFAGRLEVPVTEMLSSEQMTQWIADHPGGVIIAKSHRIAPDWPPAHEFLYRGRMYRLWYVPDSAG